MNHYPYSGDYFPAAPILEIYLGQPGKQPIIGPLQALVDTGSDTTFIPINYLKQVKAQKVDTSFLCSHWGERRTVFLYEELVRASVEELLASPEETFLEAVDYVLKKNQELYKRLAA